jgi:Leucine-rich repeat (LRR) protein
MKTGRYDLGRLRPPLSHHFNCCESQSARIQKAIGTATMDIGKDESASNMHDMHDSVSELHEIGLEDQGQVSVSPGGEMPVHDQLPNIEEYKTSQQVGGSSRASLKATVAIALMIVIASILIAVGVVIGRDNPSAPKEANPVAYVPDSPEPLPTTDTRIFEVSTMIVNMGWAEGKAINTANTPQWKAAQWLANDDPMQMKIEVVEELMNRYLLATIYFALGGENWDYDLNWLSAGSVCTWNSYFESKVGVKVQVGVSCHTGDSVKEIFLPSMGLKGAMPSEIGLFFDLQDLNLFGNSVSGHLPESMKNLHDLRTLILHDNKFNGLLPSWISSLKSLKTLNVAENKLNGPLPSGMAALTGLETLVLEKNGFTGSLDRLMGLSRLKGLYLGNNQFSGELSDDVFMSWKTIEVMDMSDNQLSGSLPSMLIGKDNLLVVDLHGNHFSGHLPSIVEVDGSIEFLALHDNELTGQIDDRLLSLTKLAHLDLSKNFFTGAMPTSLGMLKTLKYLYLAFNDQFTAGPVPAEYATLPNLVDLSLQKTNRIGLIPYQFEALSQLLLLDLNSNMLSGPIPAEIGGITNLKFLLLKENRINGTIPDTFKNLLHLDTLLLDDTFITGGTSNVCSPKLPALTTFIGDCVKMVSCSCCTKCCAASDTTCNDITWFSEVDPIAEGNYARTNYVFNEADIVYPAPKQTTSQKQTGYYQNFTGYYISEP